MEFRYLSKLFYQKYSNCSEIMDKGETRPYVIIVVEIENTKFAIPIRTKLHGIQDCFQSNPETNSGLDYTKSVVITRDDYIETSKYPEIEHKEFNYIKFKEREIKIAFSRFVDAYKKDYLRHKKNPEIPANPRFQYCTLQYFIDELGLNDDK